MKNIVKQYKIIIPTLIIGLLIGWFVLGSGSRRNEGIAEADHEHTESVGGVWTCSMHPQIRQDKPGQCPICGMDLIPAEDQSSSDAGVDPNEVPMTPSAIALARIQTTEVELGNSDHQVKLQGKIEVDERRIAEATARFGGRIEELFVSFTGQFVKKGDPLASIFSPELVSAQKELLEAASDKAANPAIYEATRAKLRLWDLTGEQIDQIEKAGQPENYFQVLSPISGTVTMRKVAKGDYIKKGDALFSLVDLSQVWVVLDAYESDLPWVSLHDPVEYWLTSQSAKKYKSKVEFVNPVVDPQKRTAAVRFSVSNIDASLKPGMFVSAQIQGKLTGKPGHLMIPKSAVLWTGKRSLVYVSVPERETPSFLMREILLGPEAGDFYIVEEGLEAGEEIVTNGVFKVDASAQLRGLHSMMNPDKPDQTVMDDLQEMDMKGMGDSVPVQTAEIKPFDVDPLFQLSLNDLYKAYLPMKDAFVLTHARKARKAAKKLIPVLEAIDMNMLDGDAHMAWMGQFEKMKKSVQQIADSKDIEEQRMAFSNFNEGFYEAVKSFGLNNKKVYYQFCPMAFDDRGAYWFSNEEIISNPYYGDVMLRCGEVVEVIEN